MSETTESTAIPYSNTSVIKVPELPVFNDGSILLDNGDIVLPEELEFYDDLLDSLTYTDWFSEEAKTTEGGAYKEIVKLTPSEWTEFAVNLPIEGVPQPFSFQGREYLRPLYDIFTQRLLLVFGRQCEKSTLLGNSILARMCIIPHFRALYVSPSHQQTKEFRRDRVSTVIALSKVFQAYVSPKYANNQSILQFLNLSQLVLRYAYLTADRCRGIATDCVFIDEIQDILTDNIPVIEETASHANPSLKAFTYSGTPKSFDNTIEQLWAKRSTQNEYAIPCECRTIFDMSAATGGVSRRFWNAPLNEDNMGSKGLICVRCKKSISAKHHDCQWVSMNPTIREHPRLRPFEGFRIPQIVVPWVEWRDLLNKRESYSRARFHNEVLALSYDSGSRPLRIQDLMRNSRPDIQMDVEPYIIKQRYPGVALFLGIDWGHEKAYTVACIGGYLEGRYGDGKFTVIYWKRYTGPEVEPEVQIQDIFRMIDLFNPLVIGTDYGGGFDRNSKLMRRYGPTRLVKYQYIGGHQATKRSKIHYDGAKGRYMLDRTEVMSDIFNAIRDDKLGFPNWAHWQEPYASDMLSIFSEYNETIRMLQYTKSPDVTDDSYHALLYCFLASMVRFPRPDVLRPLQEAPR